MNKVTRNILEYAAFSSVVIVLMGLNLADLAAALGVFFGGYKAIQVGIHELEEIDRKASRKKILGTIDL